MKSLSQINLLIIAGALQVSNASADWPTLRQLPTDFPAETENWKFLRSNEIVNKFYVLPKKLNVVSQKISDQRVSVEDCAVVDAFNQKVRALAQSEVTMAEVLTERTNNLRYLSTLESQKRNLEKELKEMELKIADHRIKGETAKAEALQEIYNIKSKTKIEIVTQLTEAIQIDTKMKESVTEVQGQIDAMKRAVETMRTQTQEAVANLRASLVINKPKVANLEWKKSEGLRGTENLIIPSVYGLYLRPAGDETLSAGGSEIPVLEEQMKRFRAQWFGVKGLDFSEATLAAQLLPVTKSVALPDQISFKRPLTFNDYCAIARADVVSKELIEDYQISYVNAYWSDRGLLRLNGTQLFAFTQVLSNEAVQALAKSDSARTAPTPGTVVDDIGEPARYGGDALFDSLTTTMQTINQLPGQGGQK